MADEDAWTPFRPTADDLKAIAEDVSEIPDIQKTLVEKAEALHFPDRVAHQYQVAASRVTLNVADDLPAELLGVGLFQPGATHTGIGRISTGLGTPHIETNPDFLGFMVAFQTKGGHRVDLLGLNAPTAPTDDHRDFMDVLHATGESAGAEIPLIGDWGEYNLGNVLAEQKEFGAALSKRMGLVKAGRTMLHLTKQTTRTFRSSTAYQAYWTGIVEASGTAGKFTFVPVRDENHHPEFRPGERHLTDEWKKRQSEGDIEFLLFWISYLNEEQTPTRELTSPWEEQHRKLVGKVIFPKADVDSEEATLWATLAAEMGANPGNWVANKDNSIAEPATEFGNARKLAYHRSQEGRASLDPKSYQSIFETGVISPELAQELRKRRAEKDAAHHVNCAPKV